MYKKNNINNILVLSLLILIISINCYHYLYAEISINDSNLETALNKILVS